LQRSLTVSQSRHHYTTVTNEKKVSTITIKYYPLTNLPVYTKITKPAAHKHVHIPQMTPIYILLAATIALASPNILTLVPVGVTVIIVIGA
jgi:hypothetical protein